MVFRLCMIDSFQKFNIEAFFKARNFSLYCIKCIMWKLECCSLLGADDLNFILRFIIFSLCLSECTHDASCARAPREARTGCETPWKCHRQWWHSKLFMLSGGKKKNHTVMRCTIWDIFVLTFGFLPLVFEYILGTEINSLVLCPASYPTLYCCSISISWRLFFFIPVDSLDMVWTFYFSGRFLGSQSSDSKQYHMG